ncbi:MAG TPA: transcriptional repressor [Acidimicrobiales bacterium]|nr:transcriptional repressor [Acidimicrobiales bacterium]
MATARQRGHAPRTEGGPVERILALIRSRGGRVTTQRRTILEAFFDGGGHLSADDVIAYVTGQLPEVNQSTIYRNLAALEELGVVNHVHLGHGASMYEVTDEVHAHLVCERCGAVLELAPGILSRLARDVGKTHGFAIDSPHFALTGRCRGCASASHAARA